jgi:ubiquinone/menaquinone biosynthesis C-methylase UbiE
MIADDFDYLAPGGRSFTFTSGTIARLNKRSRVLEIASGRGEAACALAGRFGCRVEGFDIDPNMVEYAREKATALELQGQVDFQVKDGRNLDFGTGHYNLVLAEGGALTYVGREEGVARCAELLKEGGSLALTDMIYTSSDVPPAVREAYEEGVFEYLTEIGYREMLERHGFEIVHLSLLPQSAWDRYYMSIQRKISGHNEVSPEFRDAIAREIDVYYYKGGMHHVAYVYTVARMARNKQVGKGPKNLRVPLFGQWAVPKAPRKGTRKK